jgi:hypothetical protein
MSSRRTDVNTTINRLKEQVERLREEHSQAIKSATYLGVTREQALENDARRKRISALYSQIAELERERDGYRREE